MYDIVSLMKKWQMMKFMRKYPRRVEILIINVIDKDLNRGDFP